MNEVMTDIFFESVASAYAEGMISQADYYKAMWYLEAHGTGEKISQWAKSHKEGR